MWEGLQSGCVYSTTTVDYGSIVVRDCEDGAQFISKGNKKLDESHVVAVRHAPADRRSARAGGCFGVYSA